MKNVVRKFIGKNEKELNNELVSMAAYYGYEINVTNCYSGNEKGSVENSVKVLRNKIFAGNYNFASLDAAREYMRSRLMKLNADSEIEEEKKHLLPRKPPLELAVLSHNTVNPYSMICVDTAFYSVPEEFAGKKVSAKKYHDEIRIFANEGTNSVEICRHKRIFGKGNMSVDISHYLNSLLRKPGAVKNSRALKSIPKLKSIFDTYYAEEPKKFIEIFLENKELPIHAIVALFEKKTNDSAGSRAQLQALDIVKPLTGTEVKARSAIANYEQLINAGVKKRA